MSARPRPAFTLFQLLVVLAMLAIGFALFLPALAKVRAAAARMQSQNNLKQIGLAAHNYYDANNVFPPGCDAQNFSAAVHLLPYIEQGNVYKPIDLKKSVDDKANADARKTSIKTFLSPLDPAEDGQGRLRADQLPVQRRLQARPRRQRRHLLPRLQDHASPTSPTAPATRCSPARRSRATAGPRREDVRRQYVLLKKDALKGIKDDAGVQDFKDDKNIAGDRCASWMDGRFLQGTFNGTRSSSTTTGPT